MHTISWVEESVIDSTDCVEVGVKEWVVLDTSIDIKWLFLVNRYPANQVLMREVAKV